MMISQFADIYLFLLKIKKINIIYLNMRLYQFSITTYSYEVKKCNHTRVLLIEYEIQSNQCIINEFEKKMFKFYNKNYTISVF